MFSSPSVRLFTSENADNMLQRKPGTNQLSRKPFVDRSVNSKTPDITNKPLKSKLTYVKDTNIIEKPKKFKDIDDEDFMYSFKNVEDTYDDICGQPRLSKEGVIKILRNYCNREDTPPPPSPVPMELEINPIFFELPELEVLKFDEDVWNKTYDVELPELDCGDLDISV